MHDTVLQLIPSPWPKTNTVNNNVLNIILSYLYLFFQCCSRNTKATTPSLERAPWAGAKHKPAQVPRLKNKRGNQPIKGH